MIAADVWRRDGVPDKPGAWLTTVARNKELDRIRREARRAPKEAEAFRYLTEASESKYDVDNRDDRLRLLFTCCHPALSPESQVALALRTICGLTTVDIARVFLVPEATIGQRISRAKAKIAQARIPYRVPDPHELPDRLRPVLTTVYAVFTAGHHAPVGEQGGRVDLADEAIRLARVLVDLMPDEAECVGLLALTLATDARRAARTDSTGEMVLLADQDRSLWPRGHRRGRSAGRLGAASRPTWRLSMQAAIACLHGAAPSYAETDWSQIAELYLLLEHRWPTPAFTSTGLSRLPKSLDPRRSGAARGVGRNGNRTMAPLLVDARRLRAPPRRAGDRRRVVPAGPQLPVQRQRSALPRATPRLAHLAGASPGGRWHTRTVAQPSRSRSFLATIVGYLIVIVLAVIVLRFVLGTIYWLLRAFFVVILLFVLLVVYLRLKTPD